MLCRYWIEIEGFGKPYEMTKSLIRTYDFPWCQDRADLIPLVTSHEISSKICENFDLPENR